MFPKPIKILGPQEQHCFKCSPLSFLLQWHNHLYTQFIVNVTFRIIDYRISLGETKNELPEPLGHIWPNLSEGKFGFIGPTWNLCGL